MSFALSSLLELCQRQSIPLAIALFIVFPVLTFAISTAFYQQGVASNASGKTPPTVPYLIPGLYHSVGLISRPATYFTNWIKEHGSHGPFVVKAGRTSYVVIRAPSHVESILASETMTTDFQRAEMYDKVFGASKAALASYKSLGTQSEQTNQINHAHFDLAQKYLTGSSLASLADIYIAVFRRNMSNKMFQQDSWTQIEDLWSFFEIEITRATNETLFGSALMKQYPKITQDFWKLEPNIDHFLPGLPRLTVSGVYEVRDRILEGLKKWLQATHGGTGFAKVEKDDSEWDESKGSKYFQERDAVFSRMPSHDYQSRAAEALSVMESSLSTTMPPSFWCIVEVLRSPALVRHLRGEIARYYNPQTEAYNTEAISKEPIIESILAEIGRLHMATRTIRTAQSGSVKLDDRFTLPKGASAIMFSQDLGLNVAEWTKARPHTVTRPLEKFWAERFLLPDEQSHARRNKRRGVEIATGPFSLEGLAPLNIPFGGGSGSLPTRSFAKTIQASTLAILLTEFEVQLCEPEFITQDLPAVGDFAYGIVKPLEKIAIRIRKRRPGERSN